MRLFWHILVFTCSFATIGAQPCLPSVNLGSTISFCSGNTLQLSALNPGATYLWSTGDTTATLTVTSSGVYSVTVTNSCGSVTDSVQIITSQPIVSQLGPHRAICANQSTVLRMSPSDGTVYQWSTGAFTDSIVVNSPGTYYVTATNACGVYTDTVTLTQDAPLQPNLGNDIIECTDTIVTLQPNLPHAQLLWSTGDTTRTLKVTQSGSYHVKAINACGLFSDTINVSFQQQNQLFKSDTLELCSNGSLTLEPFVTGTAYLWSTSQTDSAITVTQPGIYHLQLTTACGIITDSVIVQLKPDPVINLGADTTICSNSPLLLQSGYPAATSYLWSNNSTAQNILVNQPGLYWVQVTTSCGVFTDSINVQTTVFPSRVFQDTLTFCPGSGRNANPGFYGPGTQYLWSDSSVARINHLSTEGPYWVEISNACNSRRFHFYLKADSMRSIDLGADTLVLCDTVIMLEAKGARSTDSIVWSTGAQGYNFTATSTGTYWVRVHNQCGSYYDTLEVELLKPAKGFDSDTLTLCTSNTNGLSLSVPNKQDSRYLWFNGDTLSHTRVYTPGTYWLEIRNRCDTLLDTVVVRQASPLSINLGPNRTICNGSRLRFNLNPYPHDSLRWSDGLKSAQRTISSSGTYWVDIYTHCGTFSDTVQVQIQPNPQAFLGDTSLCQGNALLIDATQAQGQSYLWSTGDTVPQISLTQAGWYWVKTSGHCITITDSFYLSVDTTLGTVNLGADTVFCSGTLTLDAGNHSQSLIRWQDGSTNRYFTVNQSGTYYVTVTNGCGQISDSITVTITGPPTAVLGTFVRYCVTNTLTLNAQNPGSSYLWNTGDTTQAITIRQPGLYWVQVTNSCGVAVDSVQALIDQPPQNFELGNDTTICPGDSILLNTNYPHLLTNWSNGDPGPTLWVSQPGLYWAEVNNSCGSFYDTIRIYHHQNPGPIDLGVTRHICSVNDSVRLSAPEPGYRYLWNTGDTTQSITVNQSGRYTLTVTNPCGASSIGIVDVVEDEPLFFDLGQDTLLCPGDQLWLNTGLTTTVRWNDGFEGTQRLITTGGTYIASSQNACGTFSDTLTVEYQLAPDFTAERLVMCANDSLFFNLETWLHNQSFDLSEYDAFWEDGAALPLRSFTEEKTYILNFANNCDVYQQEFWVETESCDCPVHIPNAFTPNGDGRNDLFELKSTCNYTRYHLRIFNRWGDLVFESKDPTLHWNGIQFGKEAPSGTYSYFLDYGWDQLDENHRSERQGTLHLLR